MMNQTIYHTNPITQNPLERLGFFILKIIDKKFGGCVFFTTFTP